MSQQHHTDSTVHIKIFSHIHNCTEVRIVKLLLWSIIVGFCCFSFGDLWAQAVPAQPVPNPLSLPNVQLSLDGGEGDWVGALRILAILTLMTLGPAAILTMTSFTRIIIVFSLMRQALGTQQSPPNQVIIALALLSSGMVISEIESTGPKSSSVIVTVP